MESKAFFVSGFRQTYFPDSTPNVILPNLPSIDNFTKQFSMYHSGLSLLVRRLYDYPLLSELHHLT